MNNAEQSGYVLKAGIMVLYYKLGEDHLFLVPLPFSLNFIL
jgi:hypothetical protein